MYRARIKAIAHNSKNTTTPEIAVAIQNALVQLTGHQKGHGVTETANRRHRSAGVPRSQGDPRPVSDPSSDKASAKPMLMPAPIEAANPTRKVCQF